MLLVTLALLLTLAPGSPPAGADAADAPGGPPAFARLSAGNTHTCAVVGTGSLHCWGANGFGQLGLGDNADRGDAAGEMGDDLPYVDLGAGQRALTVAPGNTHTCALLVGGTVKCWGFGVNGRTGRGNTSNVGNAPGQMGDALPTVSLGTGRTATALATGDGHSCALLDDATVKCWGANALGQLGLGDTADRGDAAGEMGNSLPTVNLGSGRTATAITAGTDFTCALLDNGNVKCWGANDAGQLGQGDTATRGDGANEMGGNLAAVPLGGGRTATALGAGSNHVCALLDNAAVKCWGDAAFGQLGLGDTADRGDAAGEMGGNLPAVSLGTGRTATSITVGNSHSCALLDNATTKCWGQNTHGQLGIGSVNHRGDGAGEMGDSLPTVDFGAGRSASAVTAGGQFNCALLDDASLKCWGSNATFGALGLGDEDSRGGLPTDMGANLPAVDLGQPHPVTQVAQGDSFSCAVLDDGAVRCWGRGPSLGLGTTTSRGDGPGEMGGDLPAVDLGANRTAVAVTAGRQHACALLDNGSVKCWGENGDGQLGLGDTADRGDAPGEMGSNLPSVNLGPGRTAVAISAGHAHTCAVLDDATLKCWGDNALGQLGQGDTADRGDGPGEMAGNLAAVSLGSARTAVAVVAGRDHTCVLMDNAKVKCWGGNAVGQLGLGDNVGRGDGPGEMGGTLAAVTLGTGRTVERLAAGAQHTCAVLDDATVKCWGLNFNGQLGLGNTLARGDGANEMGNNLAAVALGTGRTAVDVGLGDIHTCAVLDDGSVKCWGGNSAGQLGLGDLVARGDGAGEMGDSLPTVDLGTGRDTRAIAVDGVSACALLDVSQLRCWGAGSSGGLGQGDTTTRGDGPGELGDALPYVELTGRGRGTITGTVTDSVSGAPLSGVYVAAMRTSDFTIVAGAIADAAGTYGFDLDEGAYFLYLIDPQAGHVEGFAGPPTRATVVEGTTIDVDGAMAPKQGSIAGTVTRDGGAPVIASAWALASSMVNGAPERGAVAPGNGQYTITGLDAATHAVVYLDPSGNHSPEYLGDSSSFPGTVATVTAGATTTANPTLPTQTAIAGGTTLSGTVTRSGTGTPLAGIWVMALRSSDFAFARGTITAPNGTYALDVQAGQYRLAFIDPAGLHEMEWHDNLPYSGLASASPVTSPSVNDAALTRTQGGFSGTVTDQTDGAAIAGVWVIAIDATGSLRGGRTTDAGGNYAFSTLPVGTYRVAFIDPVGGRPLEYWQDSLDFNGGDDIIVTPGSNLDVDAVLN